MSFLTLRRMPSAARENAGRRHARNLLISIGLWDRTVDHDQSRFSNSEI
jgi:hypothetical protein